MTPAQSGTVWHGTGALLRPRQVRFLAVLIVAPSVAEASRVGGVPLRSAFRWLADPTFRMALAEAQDEIARSGVSGASQVVELAERASLGLLGQLTTDFSLCVCGGRRDEHPVEGCRRFRSRYRLRDLIALIRLLVRISRHEKRMDRILGLDGSPPAA